MPSYPLAFPTNVEPERVRVVPRFVTPKSEAPTTLAQKVYKHPGKRWEIDVKLQAMSHRDAAFWTQFFYDLQGRYGTFTLNLDKYAPGLRVSATAAEVFTVAFAGATPAGLANKYVTFEDAVGPVYAWFNLDAAGVDPLASGRGIYVPITTGMTAGQIATAFATAVDADLWFAAAAATTTVTVTNSAQGTRTDATNGNSGMTVTTTQQGVGSTPGNITFRLAEEDTGWDGEMAREFGFTFRALEDV